MFGMPKNEKNEFLIHFPFSVKNHVWCAYEGTLEYIWHRQKKRFFKENAADRGIMQFISLNETDFTGMWYVQHLHLIRRSSFLSFLEEILLRGNAS